MPGKLIFCGNLCSGYDRAGRLGLLSADTAAQPAGMERLHGTGAGKRDGPSAPPGAHGSLFLHEGFKLYRLGAMALVLLVLAAGSVRMATGIPDREGDPDQRAYTYYLERIQGLYTKETQNLLRKEEAVMALQDEEAKEMERGYQDGTIGKEEYAEWGDERMRMIQARGEEYGSGIGAGASDCTDDSGDRGGGKVWDLPM